jgi:hypothetical protein
MNKKGQFLGILVFILFIVLLIVSMMFLVNLGIKKECKMEAEIMGLDWKYNFWIDCMINVNGNWIKMKNYIINEEVPKKAEGGK